MKREFKDYKLAKDYPLAGKKAGETVRLATVSKTIAPYLEGAKEEEEEDETPTKEWTVADITDWLMSKGITDAKGTKDDLLKEVKKVLKA